MFELWVFGLREIFDKVLIFSRSLAFVRLKFRVNRFSLWIHRRGEGTASTHCTRIPPTDIFYQITAFQGRMWNCLQDYLSVSSPVGQIRIIPQVLQDFFINSSALSFLKFKRFPVIVLSAELSEVYNEGSLSENNFKHLLVTVTPFHHYIWRGQGEQKLGSKSMDNVWSVIFTVRFMTVGSILVSTWLYTHFLFVYLQIKVRSQSHVVKWNFMLVLGPSLVSENIINPEISPGVGEGGGVITGRVVI